MKNLLIPLILIFGLIISCSINDISGTNDNNEPADLELSISLAKAPMKIISMSGYLTKSGEDTIKFDFTIEGDNAYCKVKDIKPGEWELTVNAYNANYELAYTGSTTVKIKPGEETTVYLQLDPATGSLRVIVTWGNDGDEFILLYNHTVAPGNVYTFDLKTNSLQKLTDEDRAEYPIYLSNINKIGYLRKSQREFRIMDLNGSNNEDFFQFSSYYPYSPVFCHTYNKIYFYIIEGKRQLARIDYNGKNFEYLTSNTTYNNLLPSINSKGDFLLYSSNKTINNNIYLLDLNSSSEIQLTFNTESSVYPEWSHSKNGFFYKLHSTENKKVMYYSFNTKSSEVIYENSDQCIRYYCMSPDDSKIALILTSLPYDSYNPGNLYIYDRKTKTLVQKTFTNLLFGNPKWYKK